MGNLPCIKTYGIIFCQHGIFVNYNEPGYWPTFFFEHGEPAKGPGVCPLPPTNENLARKNFRGLYMWTSDDWPPKNMMASTTQKWKCTKTYKTLGIFSSNQQEWGFWMGSDIPVGMSEHYPTYPEKSYLDSIDAVTSQTAQNRTDFRLVFGGSTWNLEPIGMGTWNGRRTGGDGRTPKKCSKRYFNGLVWGETVAKKLLSPSDLGHISSDFRETEICSDPTIGHFSSNFPPCGHPTGDVETLPLTKTHHLSKKNPHFWDPARSG